MSKTTSRRVGTSQVILLGAAVATLGLLDPGRSAACLPDYRSRIQTAPGGAYLLVMVSPLPVAEDQDNRPLDPARSGLRLRDRYRESGLYRNDGSSEPLWFLPFMDGNLPAEVARDGSCVVFGADPCDLGSHAVTIYRQGRHIVTFGKRQLVSCYDSKRLLAMLCGGEGVDPIRGELNLEQRTYTMTGEQGEIFVLDVDDGRVVRHVSPWPRYVLSFLVLVPAGVVLIWYRPWLSYWIHRFGGTSLGRETSGPRRLGWQRFSLRGVLLGVTLLCVALAFRKLVVLGELLGIVAVAAGCVTLLFRRSFRSFLIGGVMGCYGCLLGLMLGDRLGGHFSSYGVAPPYIVLSTVVAGLLLGAVATGLTERMVAGWKRRLPLVAAFGEEKRDDAGRAHAG